MHRSRPSRRAVLTGALALGATALLRPVGALAAGPAIRVARDPNCGCCGAWADILSDEGFEVTVENLSPEALRARKIASGVPAGMVACHTATVEGYTIEGHVPPADIRRLLAERPDAVGLAVPGMPVGSPGMGPESRREAYEVHLIGRDGATRVFSRHAAA